MAVELGLTTRYDLAWYSEKALDVNFQINIHVAM